MEGRVGENFVFTPQIGNVQKGKNWVTGRPLPQACFSRDSESGYKDSSPGRASNRLAMFGWASVEQISRKKKKEAGGIRRKTADPSRWPKRRRLVRGVGDDVCTSLGRVGIIIGNLDS